jgi:hypothetical protein
MTHHDVHEGDHVHQPVQEPGNSWTSYAVVKYGFILVITIVILYFLARYLLPLFTD